MLSVLKKRYGMKILAFTFDNGFMPERTYINIRNVTARLGIDHIFFKPDRTVLGKIFLSAAKASWYSPKAAERASAICTTCIGLMKYAALKTAIYKNIPLIAFGWSPGQAPLSSAILKIHPDMIRSMEDVIKKPVTKIVGKKKAGIFFLGARHYSRPDRFPYYVHPLSFSAYDEKKIFKEIKALGWKRPAGLDMNSTNCLLNSYAIKFHKEKYGFNPYAYELAQLVREGAMSRKAAIARLNAPISKRTLEAVRRKLKR